MLFNKLLLPLLIPFLQVAPVSGATIELRRTDDWFSVLSGNGLQAGDEVVLFGGVYTDSRRLVIRHRGTAGKPIIIRAKEGETVVFRRPDASQNTFNLEGNQHLHLIGLEITGGASAIRIGPHGERQPSDLLLQGLSIHHIGGVAVTCNHEGADYRRIVFRGNHIHHTSGHGEAFYLGGNNATAIISESVIENNYIHDLNGEKVSQGDGIEIKHGSFGNLIIGNVIHDTKYPGITVYGTNGRTRNKIEGNLVWNTGDHGIQVAADAVIRDNFVANAHGCGIYSREHQGAIPGNLRIEANRVVASHSAAIRIIGSSKFRSQMAPIELIGNRLLASKGQPAIRVDQEANLTGRGNQGRGEVVGADDISGFWNSNPLAKVELPELPNHPAWKFLDQGSVEKLFAGDDLSVSDVP